MDVECETCGKAFKSNHRLKVHKCVAEPVFECEFCDFNTTRKEALDQHVDVCKAKTKVGELLAKIEKLKAELNTERGYSESARKEVRTREEIYDSLREYVRELRKLGKKQDVRIVELKRNNFELSLEVADLKNVVKTYRKWKGTVPRKNIPPLQIPEEVEDDE